MEINKLRSAQNSHVPISGLPSELLSEALLYIVESDLQEDSTCFLTGTFNFRQVCKHWNEVAISFPRLWVWWLPGAVKAWPLFKARSKDAPIYLTWRPALTRCSPSFRDIFRDPALPARVCQLDFTGSSEELEYLLSAFDSSPPSSVSSIRFHVTIPYHLENRQEHVPRIPSFSFPKLSKLDIEHVQLDCLSSVFTTSNLTSLKLRFHYDTGRRRYTMTQFSQVLQNYPNLRELHLTDGAIPRVDSSEAIVLPRLVDLELCGMVECIMGSINVIGLPSHLRNVGLHFRCPRGLNVPALINTVKKVLATYYKCEGPEYPRKVNHLTVSRGEYSPLCFITEPRPTPTSTPQSTLRLEFDRMNELLDIFPLLPLDDVQEFTVDGLDISSAEYHKLFQRMKDVPCLHLAALDITPVLRVMNSRGRGVRGRGMSNGASETSHCTTHTCTDKPAQQALLKLTSLTLSHLDLLCGVDSDLSAFLEERRNQGIGLKRLVVESCRVHAVEEESEIRELVEELEWIKPLPMGIYYRGTPSPELYFDEQDGYHPPLVRAFPEYD